MGRAVIKELWKKEKRTWMKERIVNGKRTIEEKLKSISYNGYVPANFEQISTLNKHHINSSGNEDHQFHFKKICLGYICKAYSAFIIYAIVSNTNFIITTINLSITSLLGPTSECLPKFHLLNQCKLPYFRQKFQQKSLLC